jgi:hypothetical protein
MSDEPKLLPCPFCGGDAEIDTRRGYRQLPTGVVGGGVAIYCTNCSSDMMHCYEDHSGVDRDDLRADLVAAWNKRAAEAAAFRRGVEAARAQIFTYITDMEVPASGGDDYRAGWSDGAAEVQADIAALPPPEDRP